MRTLIGLALTVFALVGCSSYQEDYRHTSGRYYPDNNSYYGRGNPGGGSYIYETNTYSTYYPFGNMYYPRDRIWIIQNYGGCNYYSYRGYCYRYRDDFDRVIIWDRQHGYDDNWYRKRLDWCRRHDCRHDDIVRDSRGRPVKPQHVERDRMQSVEPHTSPRPPRPVYETTEHGTTDRDGRPSRWDRYDNDGNGHDHDRQPVVRYSQQPVTTRDTNNGNTGVEQPQTVPSQPVIQHSRPVFMPRNGNSGWGGSAGGRGSDSSGRYGSALPRGSERQQDVSPVRASNGDGRSQGDSGNKNRQRQWDRRGGDASGDGQ